MASVSSYITARVSPFLSLRVRERCVTSCSALLDVWMEIGWTQSVCFGPCWGREAGPCGVSWWNGPLSGSPLSWTLWWASLSWWKPHTSRHTWHSGRLCNCSPGLSLWRYNPCSGHWAASGDTKKVSYVRSRHTDRSMLSDLFRYTSICIKVLYYHYTGFIPPLKMAVLY